MSDTTTDDMMRYFGFSKRTLYRWAKSGLVTPSERTQSGRANYTLTDMRKLSIIKTLTDEGYSIQKIRKLLPVILLAIERL